MTLLFSEEELKWIIKEPFHWRLKEGCPMKYRTGIEQKLSLLYGKEENYV